MRDQARNRRNAGHRRVSVALAGRTDAQLVDLLEGARHGTVGIGGSPAWLDVDGAPVFAKRIPLTDLERRPDLVGSTTNLFGLPARCHFGIGGPGFGAWRELAATAAASRWVLDGRSESFPLLHHWRVLPGAPPPSAELADVDAAVTYWDHPALRHRLEQLAGASWSLVLFLERIPGTVTEWLADPATSVPDAAAVIEDELLAAAAFMSSRGVVHFDAHFDNVLTDGRRLYVADFGLATSADFALSPDEADLVEQARAHDVSYAATRLVNRLATTFGDPAFLGDPVARNAFVRDCADGVEPGGFPAGPAETVRRYAGVAAVVNDFYAELFTVRRDAPFPAAEVEREWRRLTSSGGGGGPAAAPSSNPLLRHRPGPNTKNAPVSDQGVRFDGARYWD